jgi:hypothetical protein
LEISETTTTGVEELSKSQNIRLIDIFVIAPFLIYVGNKAKGISSIERNMLYAVGIATLLYNGKNYLKNK